MSWSIMHPVKPEIEYLRAVIAAADRYRVDSFELCGAVHSSQGGLEGGIRFQDYPSAQAKLDLPAIAANITVLREVVDVAHRSGRPLYFWHREVMVPRAVVESVPGLLDENGEFDLLGAAYHDLIRSKLNEFFTNVPGMDGLVLTVTESDYSVIHNSNPRRYPPTTVMQKVVTTFAEELQRRRKRFILRSFGSIAQDYQDILAGADAVSTEFPFEIETKITPYDFSPFMALNPFLHHSGQASLSAEYDSIGEFLGAGFLPAPDPARVLECVAFARKQEVERHVIRIDRIGHATFDSAQAINLHAFDRAIHDPTVTAETIWGEWAATHWPSGATRMTALMQRGIEVVKKTHFIDGHVIFHAFPIDPDLKWIKACGILALWQPGLPLDRHQGMWGILTDRITPRREQILIEKEAAVRLADEALIELRAIASTLPAEEFEMAEHAWKNATIVTRLIRHFCRCVSAYFEDMESRRESHPALTKAIASGEPLFASLGLSPLRESADHPRERPLNPENAYGSHEESEDSVIGAYARPLQRIVAFLEAEFHGEFVDRARWRHRSDLVDFILCGSITDDFRVHRYMHAGHARLIEGRPARAAGNRVFPNGFLECELAAPTDTPVALLIEGDPRASRGFALIIDGATIEAVYDQQGRYLQLLSATRTGRVNVRVQKVGSEHPWIFAMAIVRAPHVTTS